MEGAMGISESFSTADIILGLAVKDKQTLLEVLATEAAGRLGHPQQPILQVAAGP